LEARLSLAPTAEQIVSLYKIAHWSINSGYASCRYAAEINQPLRSIASPATRNNGAGATMSQFYITNENNARRCNEVRSVRVSSAVTGLTIEGEIGPASMAFPSCL